VPTICSAAFGWQLFWFGKEMLIYFARAALVVQRNTLFDKVSEDIQDRGI
jgi:hypothetical protein